MKAVSAKVEEALPNPASSEEFSKKGDITVPHILAGTPKKAKMPRRDYQVPLGNER